MTAHADAISRAPNRSGRLLSVVVLIVATGVAWWRTAREAREMSCMLDGFVKAGRAMPLHVSPAGFVGMWTVMMTAMMLPAILPVAIHGDEPPSAAFTLAVGYLAVWVATGAVAFVVLTALNEMSHPTPWLHRVGGAFVALAGVYQFTGWKRRLLERNGDEGRIPGALGAFGAGLSHGRRCLGASWALMSVLLVVGVMNVVWMAAISAICVGEKLSTRRTVLGAVAGVVLVGVGLVIVFDPRALDVIAGVV